MENDSEDSRTVRTRVLTTRYAKKKKEKAKGQLGLIPKS